MNEIARSLWTIDLDPVLACAHVCLQWHLTGWEQSCLRSMQTDGTNSK